MPWLGGRIDKIDGIKMYIASTIHVCRLDLPFLPVYCIDTSREGHGYRYYVFFMDQLLPSDPKIGGFK